jgi:dTDP-4-dehydrorhamnose reductase
VAEVLRRILETDICGVYNLGSNEEISKYEFNRQIMDQFIQNSSLLKPVKSVDLDIKRPSMVLSPQRRYKKTWDTLFLPLI